MKTLLQIYKESVEKLDEGEWISFSPIGWNKENIIGYQCAKTDFKSFLKSHTIALIEGYIEELESRKKDELVCAYCHDSGFMRVQKMRGNGYDNKKCVWCRDGKEELSPDQLTSLYSGYNKILQDQITYLEQQLQAIKSEE